MEIGKSIEIPFGAKDSELKGWEYTVPEGMEAEIKDGKIIVREKESEDERIRKALIRGIESVCKEEEVFTGGFTRKQIVAWLEKQGSQNLANSAKTCKIEQKHTLPGFEEQEGVAGRDYIPVEWVEAIENYGKWKIVRVNEQNPAWSEEDEERYISCLQRLSTGNPAQPETINSKWFKERVYPLIFGNLGIN